MPTHYLELAANNHHIWYKTQKYKQNLQLEPALRVRV